MTAQKTVWPCLRYDDARPALKFLVDVVGFTEALVVRGEDGTSVVHAELRWPEGGGVMFGETGTAGGLHDRMKPGTGAIYVVTDHVDEIHRRVRDSGAEILEDPNDTDFGSRTFTAADHEGNMWTFGTYRGA